MKILQTELSNNWKAVTQNSSSFIYLKQNKTTAWGLLQAWAKNSSDLD